MWSQAPLMLINFEPSPFGENGLEIGDGCQLDAGCEVDSLMVLEWYHLKKLFVEKDTHMSHHFSIILILPIQHSISLTVRYLKNLTFLAPFFYQDRCDFYHHVHPCGWGGQSHQSCLGGHLGYHSSDMSNPFFNGDMFGILPILTNSMRGYWYILCIFGWKWGCAGIRINNMKM